MAIVTALAIKTDIHLSRIDLGIDCKKLVTSLLRRCPFLVWDTLSCSVTVETSEATQISVSRAGNVRCIDIGGWSGIFPRSLSSLFLVIFSCQYVLWIKAS